MRSFWVLVLPFGFLVSCIGIRDGMELSQGVPTRHSLVDDKSVEEECGSEVVEEKGEIDMYRVSLEKTQHNLTMATLYVNYLGDHAQEALGQSEVEDLMIQTRDYYSTLTNGSIDIDIDQDNDGHPDVFTLNIDKPHPASKEDIRSHRNSVFATEFSRQYHRSIYSYHIVNLIIPTQTTTLVGPNYSGIAGCNDLLYNQSASGCMNILHSSLSSARLWIHEVGHNFGMGHSYRSSFHPSGASEYGDPYCLMGGSWSKNSLSPWQLWFLSKQSVDIAFLDRKIDFLEGVDLSQASPIPISNRTWDVRLAPISDSASTYPKVAYLHLGPDIRYSVSGSRVQFSAGDFQSHIFVSHRKPIGLDSEIVPSAADKIFLHGPSPVGLLREAPSIFISIPDATSEGAGIKYVIRTGCNAQYQNCTSRKTIAGPLAIRIRRIEGHSDGSETFRIERIVDEAILKN